MSARRLGLVAEIANKFGGAAKRVMARNRGEDKCRSSKGEKTDSWIQSVQAVGVAGDDRLLGLASADTSKSGNSFTSTSELALAAWQIIGKLRMVVSA